MLLSFCCSSDAEATLNTLRHASVMAGADITSDQELLIDVVELPAATQQQLQQAQQLMAVQQQLTVQQQMAVQQRKQQQRQDTSVQHRQHSAMHASPQASQPPQPAKLEQFPHPRLPKAPSWIAKAPCSTDQQLHAHQAGAGTPEQAQSTAQQQP